MVIRISLFFLAAALLGGTQLVGASDAIKQPSDTDEDITAIEAMLAQWGQDMAARGAEGFAAHFTEDGMLMPPKEAPVEGKKAILAWLSMYFDRHTSQPESAEIEKIEASGDLAFVHYHVIGSYTARATGKSIPYDQKCLDVLRRQPDGSWKVALHMWSSNNYLPSVWDKDWKKGEAAE